MEIKDTLLKIIGFIQKILILGSSFIFIYFGFLFFTKKYDKVKEGILWVILGIILLFMAYVIPVIILSFLGKSIPKP
ncbi:MAG: hypothetical protein ACP5JU_03215 [Minisyncoccia bacterium]